MSDNFVCDECGCVDSIHATKQTTPGKWLCSKCATGEWHGEFAQEQYNEDEDVDVLNRIGVDHPSFS